MTLFSVHFLLFLPSFCLCFLSDYFLKSMFQTADPLPVPGVQVAALLPVGRYSTYP